MLIATNVEKEQIQADKKLAKSETYYCPSCHSPVHLKAGSIMRAHFAHYQKDRCEVFSEGETEEHIKGKLQLKEWLEAQDLTVEMEAYLPELKQRPDLLVKLNKRKIALEFQCSPIAIAKVSERTQGYLDAGYEVVWIIGEKFKYSKQLTAFQKACLTNIKGTLVLFHYSVTKNRLEYRHHFTLKQNQKMSQTKRSIRKNSPLKLRLDEQLPLTSRPVNIEIEHSKLLRHIQFPSPKSKRFLETLYEKNETLVSMPSELYTMMPTEWMLQDYTYEWKLAFILWLESMPLNTVITQKKITNWMKNLTYYQIPQLTLEQKQQPIWDFITVLKESNVLKQIRFNKWTIVKRAKRFKHLEDKFN